MVRCHEPKGSAGYRLGKHKSAETSDVTAADRPIVCQLESAVGGHSRPKLAVPAMFAVGTRVTSRPPHRSVRAQFGHTACMGLCLSRRHHAISVVPCHSILLSDLRRKHAFVPTAYLHRRRAQRRSRTALL